MNLNNFTIKAAEVVQNAQQLAFNAKILPSKRSIYSNRCS
jgi:hypothetical protein